MAAVSNAVVKRRSAQHWEVEYEAHELPENETMDGGSSETWTNDKDVYGFDLEPCLALGCSEQLLSNQKCDEECNARECEYDMGLCFAYYDYHGYGWDFEVCYRLPVCLALPLLQRRIMTTPTRVLCSVG